MMKTTRMAVRAVLALSLSVLAFSGVASAASNLKLGNMSIKPFINVKGTSDSNIYLSSADAKSAIISNISPGVGIVWPISIHEVKLDYFAEFINYSENPSNNNAIHNNADLAVKLNTGIGLGFLLKDSYKGTTDPLTSELTERARRNQNTASAEIEYKLSSIYTAKVTLSQVVHDYIAAEYKPLFNRKENECNFELAYNVSPKTAVVADYAVGSVDYGYAVNTESSKVSQIRFGIRGELTPKTIGEIKFGTKDKKYNDIQNNDKTTSVLSMTTMTDFSKRTSLMLMGSRNFVESTLTNNPYYIASGATLRLEQKIARFWTAGLSGNYEANDYPNDITVGSKTEKRRDVNLNAGLDATYSAYEWLSVGAGYTLRQRASNFDQYKYDDGLASVFAKFIF